MKRSMWIASLLPRLACILGVLGLPHQAAAVTYGPLLGFEDDVDLIVDPAGEFLIVPEEKEDGSEARISIVDLDAASGAPIAVRTILPGLLGFENGVDPFIVRPAGSIHGTALVPCENESGTLAEVLILVIDDNGALVHGETIQLGNLGFRDDVDGIWTHYSDDQPLTAFFALESEDRTVRGVLAIDAYRLDGDVGGCSLLSTDGRVACIGGENFLVDWLPGLAEGVDPVAYSTPGSARFLLPVSGPGGSDLLFLEYDPNDAFGDHPLNIGHQSVKEANAATPHPTPFPGFERDVDLVLFQPGNCLGANQVLVPVENQSGTGGGDLYLIQADLQAGWVFSLANPTLTIPGYETGVDLVTMCSAAAVPPNRVAVPVENAAGTDADLWIVNLADGTRIAGAEAANPGLTIPGYEVGVDPMRWTVGDLLVPVEGLDGNGGLLVMTPDGLLTSVQFFTDRGFVRSVDPIVAPVPGVPDPLFVPVTNRAGTDYDVLMYPAPPFLGGGTSLETLNAGLTFSPFEVDVDLGTLLKQDPGGAYVYLAEENPLGTDARLRIELVPDVNVDLVVPTHDIPAGAAALRFFRADNGTLTTTIDDILGLELGVDMANGRGPVRLANPPQQGITPGTDADTDPTLGRSISVDASSGDLGDAGAIAVFNANPMALPGAIRLRLKAASDVRVTIVDVAGRRVRELEHGRRAAGEHSISWDGLDARGNRVAAGLYFVHVQSSGRLQVSKLVVLR